jgi:hypothetical protein
MTYKDVVLALSAEKDGFAMIPSAEVEAEIALDWLRANAPKLVEEGRVYEEIDVASLQRGTLVAFVFRSPAKPVEETARGDGGERLSVRRPHADLLSEVVCTPLIKVAAYWRQEPLRPGKPDVAGLLEQAGKLVSPYRLAYSDIASPSPSALRLRKL